MGWDFVGVKKYDSWLFVHFSTLVLESHKTILGIKVQHTNNRMQHSKKNVHNNAANMEALLRQRIGNRK